MTKSIRGQVDGFEGRFLSGWALPESKSGPCLVRVSTSDGREIGRGRASHPRDDLRGVMPERTNIGFRIPIDCPDNLDVLHVTVDKTPLVGSPLVVGRGLFDGSIFVKDGLIEGIVTERAPNAPAPLITVRDQYGRVVAEGAAVLAANNELHKPSIGRIALRLRPACFGCDELELRAYANGVHFATASCHAGLRGYLDRLTEDRCQGWLFSPDAPRQTFEIAVFQGEEQIGGGLCEVGRDDLKDMHPQAFRAGFDLPLRRARRPAHRAAPISVRLAGSRFELFDGPFSLSDQKTLVRTAREVAARNRADSTLSFAEQHCLQTAMAAFIDRQRHGGGVIRERLTPPRPVVPLVRRLNIVIPVYKDVPVTRACIESVLATRDDFWDAVILVNDAAPDPAMAPMLRHFVAAPNASARQSEKSWVCRFG
jgi:hypothetical protein